MALREILAQFRFNTDQKTLDSADKSISGIIGKVQAAAGAFATFFAVGVIKSFVTETTIAADVIAKTADELGLGIVELQEWQHVAGLGGVANEELRKSFLTLGRQVEDARDGLAESQKLFDKLEIKDPGAKPLSELYQEVGLKLAGIDDQSTRTRLSMQAFGRSGTKLFNLFKSGPEGIAAMRGELAEFGALMSEDFARQSETVNDNLSRLETTFGGIKIAILSNLLPWIIRASVGLRNFTVEARKFVTQGNIGKSMLVVLAAAAAKFGAVAAAAGLKALLPWTPFLAAIGLAVLVVDELITTFQGGDTLIRRAIDGAFGEGTTAKIVDSIKYWSGVVVEFFKNFSPRDFTRWLIEQFDAVAFAIDSGVNKAISSFLGWLDKLAPAISGVAAMITVVWFKASGVLVAGFARAGLASSAFTLRSIPALIAGLARQAAAMIAVSVTGAAAYVAGFAAMAAAQIAMLATNPFTWIVVGIGLAVAAIVWLWQNWDEVSTWVSEAASNLGSWFGEVWDGIAKGAGEAWDWIVEKVKGVVSTISDLIMKIPGVDLVVGAANAIGGLVAPALDAGAGARTTNNQTSQTNTVAPVINVDARGASNPGAVGRAVREASGQVAAATTRGFRNALVPQVT